MAENSLIPQTPDCVKCLTGSYGTHGPLSAGRPERRSVLGVLTVSILSVALSLAVWSSATCRRKREREMGQIALMSLKAKSFRRLDVF